VTGLLLTNDEALKIDVDDLAARLPDEQRLALAKALVVAAFKLCPKDGDDYLAPAALELATFMNDCVTALLHTAAERRRAALWDGFRACATADAASLH
jgi:hypothetical protein